MTLGHRNPKGRPLAAPLIVAFLAKAPALTSSCAAIGGPDAAFALAKIGKQAPACSASAFQSAKGRRNPCAAASASYSYAAPYRPRAGILIFGSYGVSIFELALATSADIPLTCLDSRAEPYKLAKAWGGASTTPSERLSRLLPNQQYFYLTLQIS